MVIKDGLVGIMCCAALGMRHSTQQCKKRLQKIEQKAPRIIQGMNASPVMAHGRGFRLHFSNVCASILPVPFQLNRVRVGKRRACRRNTTVLHHRHTPFFSRAEFVRSRALAGRESSNARKRVWTKPKARTSSTPECVGLKVRGTRHEAPPQGGESAGKVGTPWIDPGEVSVEAFSVGWLSASWFRRHPPILIKEALYMLCNGLRITTRILSSL
jgi:hypothetical protein